MSEVELVAFSPAFDNATSKSTTLQKCKTGITAKYGIYLRVSLTEENSVLQSKKNGHNRGVSQYRTCASRMEVIQEMRFEVSSRGVVL